MKQQGSNNNTIKEDNNNLILNFIRKNAISRAELVNLTGLSKSTVTTITKQLIDSGQLIEIGTKNTSSGRHPVLLDIVKDYRYAIGVEITRSTITVCVTNLKLQIVGSVKRYLIDFSKGEEILDWSYEVAKRIVNDNQIPEDKLIGIGVAMPGPLDYKNGIVMNPPDFPLFQNFNVKEYFAKKTKLTVLLNKISVPMAVYEYQKRNMQLKNFLFVNIDNGVGSAIIYNGNIYRGSYGHSGEIGHMTVDINGIPCSCGNIGCLECYVTQKSVLKDSSFSSYEALVNAAYDLNQEAVDRLNLTARYFAAALTSTVNILDLEAVIIYGELNYRCELLVSKIQEIIDHNCIITNSHPVMIMPSIMNKRDNISFTTAPVIELYYQK